MTTYLTVMLNTRNYNADYVMTFYNVSKYLHNFNVREQNMDSSKFQVRNPNYKAHVRLNFENQPLAQLIGVQISDIEAGNVTLEVPFRPELSQQLGYFHGGVMGMLADNAAGMATMTLLNEGEGLVTVEYKINFLSPAVGDRLIARGEVVRSGKTLTVCKVDIFARTNLEEKCCATALFTIIIMKSLGVT